MVTFSLPGDSDASEAVKNTPQPRPPLPFAKRAFVPSPYSNNKRLGTPQSAPPKRLFNHRDELPSSNLHKSTIASARNIFRASSISTSPPVKSFSPSLPQSTLTKTFAPSATPIPNRVFRESTAQATPRGMASKVADKELFHKRIEDPDPELSGEVLAKKIPKDWNSKGSIYADQFLAHLCPPDFDDEQRRQFFAILDLRRLKFAADEIFLKKGWNLNMVNFSKEFEKSRSIILLRYGLYEFQNVKPSKEVLKRWRREHGLPEPEDEEEEVQPTPTKSVGTKKRKADDEELPKNSGLATNNNKRRAADKDEELLAPVAAPVPSKNKRKASVSDDTESQPNKLQKATPSAAKAIFEKIANNKGLPSTGSPVKAVTKPVEESTTPKTNPFTTSKANGANTLARSVFQNLKPSNGQTNSNIFGYLSDASSTKNSGVDADGETDSDGDDSEEPSANASATETASQVESSNAFGHLSAPANAAAGGSSAPGTRESTPGRSLFDRLTKDSAGQPVRVEDKDEEAAPEKPAAKPFDQTWNPNNTPIKFAPTSSTPAPNPLFGNATSTPTSSAFGAKPTASSNMFGAKQEKLAEKETALESVVELKDKSGSESDKENDEAPKKSASESKAPALQTNATSLFQPKASTETPKSTEPAKLIFGAAKVDDKPTSNVNLFSTSKPAESTTPAPSVSESTTLFGAKPAEAPKPTSLFGASSTPSTSTSTPATSTNLFGAKPASTTSTNLFGGASSATQSVPASGANLFGGASSTPAQSTTTSTNLFGAASTPTAAPLFGASSSGDASATTKPASAPMFGLGSASSAANKPNGVSDATSKSIFPPNSPKASAPLFDGSPMKQDGPSPAKRAFNGGNVNGGAASEKPLFSFASSTPAAPIFGGASAAPAAPANGTSLFGAAPSSNTGTGTPNFSFAASGTGFHNPFSSGNDGNSNGAGSAPASSFNFGANTGSSTSSTPFQFGGGSSTAPAPTFGANQGNNSIPTFGGASGSGTSTSFTFGAGSQTQAPAFGSNQPAPAFNLQPPAGGASTGTNTPFSLGGGSSLATTPAGGTPEPSASAPATGTTTGGTEEEGEKHEQISLTEGAEKDEEILHDVRAKVLKFVPASEKSDDKPKSKSPWTTQGVGPLRLLKHKETSSVRLLMRAEPRGNVALNRSLLPNMNYKADEKYVKLTTSNETGDGLETWMIQVKTKDLAKGLAEALEKHKESNKK